MDAPMPPAEGTAPPPPAEASGPSKPISVALLVGFGLSLEKGGNPWGFGFGLRGGYNIDKIYLGARFVYYLGESQSVSVPGVGAASTTINIWELGVEGGYDVAASDKFVVRPLLGLGLASIGVSSSGSFGAGGSASTSKFFLAPGVAGLYDVTDNIFLGLDARFIIITSSPVTKGLTFLANGGMRF
jgi:hypothetical protein